MLPSPCAPIFLSASPSLATIWSAGFSEPAEQALRTLLAAAGPWTGQVGGMSLSLKALLSRDPQLPGAGSSPWYLTLRRNGPGPTLLALQGNGPRGTPLRVGLGDLNVPAPRAPEETVDLLSRALDAAFCPLLARRADLALLLVHVRLIDVGVPQAILRRNGYSWHIRWAGQQRIALPPRHRWSILLSHWMTQARRVIFSPDGVPRLEGFHNLRLHALPDSAHHRLAMTAEIARLSAILSLDQAA